MSRRNCRSALAALTLLIGALLLAAPAPARAQSAGSCTSTGGAPSTIVLDGQFYDWPGKPCIPDPATDCGLSRADLVSFFFTTAPSGQTAYFMAETRTGSNQQLGLRLLIDVNNDGDYTDSIDRIMLVSYRARQNRSEVTVDLLNGQEQWLATIASGADWGLSRVEGGNRVEWGVTLAQLGVPFGQPLRMILQSQAGNPSGNAWCDTTQVVQWSPADALGLALLALVLVGGSVLAARKRGRLA